MGLMLSRLWGVLFGNKEYKLVIVGLDNAGKTTILYKLLTNEAIQTKPTIGSNVEEVVYKNIRFLMFDVGGQETLRATWSTYYVNTQAVIMVIDSSDKERLPIAAMELHKMMEQETLKSSCLLVLANKQDVKGAMKASEISQLLKLTSFTDRNWHIQGCCALNGEGLYQGLDWIVTKLNS